MTKIYTSIEQWHQDPYIAVKPATNDKSTTVNNVIPINKDQKIYPGIKMCHGAMTPFDYDIDNEIIAMNATMAEAERNFPGGREIPLDVYRELIKLMDYVYHDEKEHHWQMQSGGEDVSQHIFNTVRRIDDWMNSSGTEINHQAGDDF